MCGICENSAGLPLIFESVDVLLFGISVDEDNGLRGASSKRVDLESRNHSPFSGTIVRCDNF